MTVEVHVISYLGYVLRPGGGGLVLCRMLGCGNLQKKGLL